MEVFVLTSDHDGLTIFEPLKSFCRTLTLRCSSAARDGAQLKNIRPNQVRIMNDNDSWFLASTLEDYAACKLSW